MSERLNETLRDIDLGRADRISIGDLDLLVAAYRDATASLQREREAREAANYAAEREEEMRRGAEIKGAEWMQRALAAGSALAAAERRAEEYRGALNEAATSMEAFTKAMEGVELRFDLHPALRLLALRARAARALLAPVPAAPSETKEHGRSCPCAGCQDTNDFIKGDDLP